MPCYQAVSIKVRMSSATPILDKCASASQKWRRSRNANMAYLDAGIPSVGHGLSRRASLDTQSHSKRRKTKIIRFCLFYLIRFLRRKNKRNIRVQFVTKKVTKFSVLFGFGKFIDFLSLFPKATENENIIFSFSLYWFSGKIGLINASYSSFFDSKNLIFRMNTQIFIVTKSLFSFLAGRSIQK